MRPEKIAVKMENLFFIREGRALLDDINLSIIEGRTTLILGIAGSGKTTLLKAAAGLLIPDSGRLQIRGKDLINISKKELEVIRRNNGFVFQDGALWADMSIEGNLSLPLLFHNPGIDKKEIDEKINYWIHRTGFWDTIKGRPAAYSMGEQKMISFIRAVINGPNMLFLDNPLELVDYRGSRNILEILKEFKEKGCTLIIVSQAPEVLQNLADDIIIIHEGKIIESGPAKSVLASTNENTKRVISNIREYEKIYIIENAETDKNIGNSKVGLADEVQD